MEVLIHLDLDEVLVPDPEDIGRLHPRVVLGLRDKDDAESPLANAGPADGLVPDLIKAFCLFHPVEEVEDL
ncbi:MAG: hypothetical protein PHY03_04295, partial [Dehalococcoidia bacterium]|nr:hypothetical protein [Dehalococcoidia bacterium]